VSNHIADTNKMVSDTPRTDNCLTEILDAFGYVHQGNCPQRWVNHSRELERELNAANESFRKLNIHALDLAARIKRLEEVGDEVVINYVNSLSAFEMWRKAKEAKP
jgi:uncharacterized protein Yka (UPF0111/DUF47 family)